MAAIGPPTANPILNTPETPPSVLDKIKSFLFGSELQADPTLTALREADSELWSANLEDDGASSEDADTNEIATYTATVIAENKKRAARIKLIGYISLGIVLSPILVPAFILTLPLLTIAFLIAGLTFIIQKQCN